MPGASDGTLLGRWLPVERGVQREDSLGLLIHAAAMHLSVTRIAATHPAAVVLAVHDDVVVVAPLSDLPRVLRTSAVAGAAVDAELAPAKWAVWSPANARVRAGWPARWSEEGLTQFSVPLGSDAFVAAAVDGLAAAHGRLTEAIVALPETKLQSQLLHDIAKHTRSTCKITGTPGHRRESGAHGIFLYLRRDPQFSNCLQRPPVQGKKACTRSYSTTLYTAKFPMQYRNDIRILDRGAPLHAPSIGLLCAQNAPGCPPTAPTLLRNRVRGGLSGAGRGNVELTGHPTIKKRNAAPTNGDRSCFPCGLSQGCFLLFRGTVYVSSHALILWLRFLCNHCITCQTESRPEKWNKNT